MNRLLNACKFCTLYRYCVQRWIERMKGRALRGPWPRRKLHPVKWTIKKLGFRPIERFAERTPPFARINWEPRRTPYRGRINVRKPTDQKKKKKCYNTRKRKWSSLMEVWNVSALFNWFKSVWVRPAIRLALVHSNLWLYLIEMPGISSVIINFIYRVTWERSTKLNEFF